MFSRSLCQTTIAVVIAVLLSGCSGASVPSMDFPSAKVYVLEARQIDVLTSRGKEVTPSEGFVFLAVDVAFENASNSWDRPCLGCDRISLQGKTSAGSYEYGSKYLILPQEPGIAISDRPVENSLWYIWNLNAPPGFRVGVTYVFEVARIVTDLRLQAGWQEGDRKTESSVDLPPLQNDTGLAIPAAQLQESAFLAPVFWGPGGSAYYRNYDFLPEINPDTKVSRHWDAILQTPQIPPGQAGQATYLVQMPLADKEVNYLTLYPACPWSETEKTENRTRGMEPNGIAIDLSTFPELKRP